jgi:putative secretion ATPase (PEP-CTERM system associated)
MYEEFYNLKEEPFRLSPNSRFCFKHPTYKKAFAYMQYALHRGEGFVMVTGQPGTGKTTLINDLISSVAEGLAVFANISSTQLEADDLLRMVAYTFGLDGKTTIKSSLLQELETFFRNTQAAGKRPLLIIDEAQGLPRGALEELRLMTNLQQNNRPLLQIFLVGQEELREMVMSPQLEQLHQRIVAACHLAALSEKDTEQYIKHRLTQVAWRNDPELDRDIFPLIRLFSDGIPRWINLICSRLLLHGMVEELHRLGVEETREVLRGLIDEQLLPGRLYAGNANLLEELKGEAPDSRYSTPPEDDAYQVDEERPDSHDVEAEPPARESNLEPEAETAFDDSPTNGPSEKSSAASLYAELQPLVAEKSNSERLVAFLEFLDGNEVEGCTLALPQEERHDLAATGLAAWFQNSHGSFDHAGLSNDILEIMGLATWLKQVQPEIGNQQLETIGLIYKYMQSGKQL